MSLNVIDAVAVIVVCLAVYAEGSRGAVQALTDAFRVGLGLAAGLIGWHLGYQLVGGQMAGLIGLLLLGVSAVLLVNIIAKRLAIDPHVGRNPLGRGIGGIVGLGLGLGVNLLIIPALAIGPAITPLVERSVIGHRFVDAVPRLYDFADRLDLRLPTVNDNTRKFPSESRDNADTYVGRMNFRKLDGAHCLECGSPVKFDGYRRVKGMTIAPHFTCPSCGRVSCGCQTFEGMHRMYQRCAYEMWARGIPLDCGTWPNDRPITPETVCPVCGRGEDR